MTPKKSLPKEEEKLEQGQAVLMNNPW